MRITRRTICCLLTAVLLSSPARAEFGDLLFEFAPSGPELDRIPYDGQEFGSQVALSSTHAFVGAEGDEYYGEGTGGTWAFDVATGAFVSAPISLDIAIDDSFAEGVAVSGSFGIVGADKHADGEGGAYIFDLVTGNQLFNLRASDHAADWEFGQSVGAFAERVVVGAEGADNGAGAIYLFDLSTGQQLQKFSVAGEAEVGNLSAIWGDVVMAGTDTETAYLFDATTGVQLHKLSVEGADGFAESIALHEKYAVVGADGVNDDRGAAYLFDVATGELLHTFQLTDGEEGDELGKRVAVEGTVVAVTAPAPGNTKKGAVYLYDAISKLQIAKIEGPGDNEEVEFGSAVAISAGRLLVGAENGISNVDGDVSASGVAYLFDINLDALADLDNDGLVTAADIDQLGRAVRAGSTDSLYDINRDEAIDNMDVRVWIEALRHTSAGDANLDGEFNSSDLVTVFQAGQYEDDIAMNSGWATGDWNFDQEFDTSDMVVAFQVGRFEQGPAAALAVPEPTFGGIALLPALLLLQRVIRRTKN